MKKLLLIISIFVSGIIFANTGFNTLWEYIESIGTSYLTNANVRNTVLTEPIANGELIKAETLNAKFDSLNKEITDIKLAVGGKILGCSAGTASATSYCYAYVTGKSQDSSVEQTYLGVLQNGSNLLIASRMTSETVNSVMWEANSYTTNESKRIKKTDISEFLGCTLNYCYVKVKGVGSGQSSEVSYLGVFVNGTNLYIVDRLTGTSSSLWDETTYPAASEAARVKSTDVKKFFGCSPGVNNGCYLIASGVSGSGATNDYLARVGSTGGSHLGIVYRSTGESQALWDETTYPAGSEASRIKSSEVSKFLGCAGLYCYANITGIGYNETIAKEYFSFLYNITYPGASGIVVRMSEASSSHPAYWSSDYTGSNDAKVQTSSVILP